MGKAFSALNMISAIPISTHQLLTMPPSTMKKRFLGLGVVQIKYWSKYPMNELYTCRILLFLDMQAKLSNSFVNNTKFIPIIVFRPHMDVDSMQTYMLSYTFFDPILRQPLSNTKADYVIHIYITCGVQVCICQEQKYTLNCVPHTCHKQ